MVTAAAPCGRAYQKLCATCAKTPWQFVAIVLLCALGTWKKEGLDGTWRMIELSAETYFTQTKLADFWVKREQRAKIGCG